MSPAARRVLSGLLVAAAFVFLAAEILRNLEMLQDFHWEVRPFLLLTSILALSGVLLWGVWVWRVVLRSFGSEVAMRPLARIWFLANLGRYIPGVIWQFVSLAHLGAAAGLPPLVAVTSLLVQMGILLLAAAILGVYLLPPSLAGDLEPLLWAARWTGPAALVLVHPGVIRGALAVVARLTRRPVIGWNGTWADGLLLLLLSCVSWILYGGAFYLFLRSLVDLPSTALPAVTAMNALAFIVGYVVFFAPGGLGFKEGALAVLLAGLMPRPVAFSLAIAARLWTIAAEVLPASFLLRGRSAKPDATTPPAAPPGLQ